MAKRNLGSRYLTVQYMLDPSAQNGIVADVRDDLVTFRIISERTLRTLALIAKVQIIDHSLIHGEPMFANDFDDALIGIAGDGHHPYTVLAIIRWV
jgi:hypothetical protein